MPIPAPVRAIGRRSTRWRFTVDDYVWLHEAGRMPVDVRTLVLPDIARLRPEPSAYATRKPIATGATRRAPNAGPAKPWRPRRCRTSCWTWKSC